MGVSNAVKGVEGEEEGAGGTEDDQVSLLATVCANEGGDLARPIINFYLIEWTARQEKEKHGLNRRKGYICMHKTIFS